MAAITSAVLGAASLGYGLYSRMEANSDAEDAYRTQQQGALIQSQAASAMHGVSVEQAASSAEYALRDFGINRQAASDSLSVSQQSQAINRMITQLSQQVEGQRKIAMEVDARRKNLEIIRNQQRARAIAQTTAVAQGGRNSSGLQGAYGQISGQTAFNEAGVNQNLQIGRSIFDLNAQITDQKIAGSRLEDAYALMRFNSQNQKAQMAYDYSVLNANYQTRIADAQQLMSQGQGIVNQGSGQANAAQNSASLANTFIGAASTIAGMGQPLNNLYNNYMGGGSNPTNVGSATSYTSPLSGYGLRGIY